MEVSDCCFIIICLLDRLSGGKASVKDCQTSLATSEKTVLAAFRKMLDGKVTNVLLI